MFVQSIIKIARRKLFQLKPNDCTRKKNHTNRKWVISKNFYYFFNFEFENEFIFLTIFES